MSLLFMLIFLKTIDNMQNNIFITNKQRRTHKNKVMNTETMYLQRKSQLALYLNKIKCKENDGFTVILWNILLITYAYL